MAAMESGSAWGLSLITNYGWLKFGTLAAAGLGALLMAMSSPPKTKREMFFQGLTALGTSFLFGDVLWLLCVQYSPFIADRVAVHGLLGALSWGLFGGLVHFRTKLGSKSLDETFKDVKNNIT